MAQVSARFACSERLIDSSFRRSMRLGVVEHIFQRILCLVHRKLDVGLAGGFGKAQYRKVRF